jgi:heat-inducible transcriptional repressor
MELQARRRRILAAVVDDYVQTAEPIGSETLARKHDFGVKPATIRNELAAMSELGYLRQPHTSAGRVPSDLGYRYYVDQLMPSPSLNPGETDLAMHGYDPTAVEVEEIVQQTCRILSSLTNCTSLATNPRADRVQVRQVALLSLKSGRLLLVTLLDTGHIDHRAMDCKYTASVSDVTTVGNLANARFSGVDLSGFAAAADEEIPNELRPLEWLYRNVCALVRQALVAATDDEVYVEGTGYILKQPEFVYSSRIAWLLDILEQRRLLFEVLGSAILGGDVTVIIGSENRFGDASDCSFVASGYSVNGRACGSIGVVGPTRMDYSRAVAAVRFMSANLSELLTALSIG